MARYNVTTGVFLTQGSGGTPQSPNATHVTTTSVMNFRETTSNGTQKRTRPVDLLGSMTTYYAEQYREERSIVSLDNGNWAPITNFISTSANKTAVYAEEVAANTRAQIKIRSKIKDMVWNSAQTAAELGKTLGFVLDTSRHIREAWKAARRGDLFALSELYQRYDFKGRRRPPAYRRVSNAWLQWRYAVRPAVMDLSDAMHELSRSGMKPIIMMASASATEDVGKNIFSGKIDNRDAFRRRDGRVRVGYKYYYTASSTANLTSLGLTNLPALLWELTPFSFVVDNFIPIGTYLCGLDAGFGITVKSGTCSVWHDWSEYATYRGARSASVVKTYSRTNTPSLPNQPLPGWKAPGGDIPSKALDSLALLSQVVRRGR